MTQTIREQLQALVKDIKFIRNMNVMLDRRCILMELESILATPDPAVTVTVRKGWVCKGRSALKFCQVYPTWYADDGNWGTDQACDEFYADRIITDPWPDHPNGGPECVMEVG